MPRSAFWLSLLLLATTLVLWQTKGAASAGPSLTAFFVALAVAVRGDARVKGLSFGLLVFAAVTIAMYYPAAFTAWGSFDLRTLIVPLLQIIMFGMGTGMGVADFAAVARSPRAVMIGLICQFTIMPFLGYGIAMTFGFPPEIAAGIVLVGAAPSGLASNVMSYLCRANLALSVTLTAVATLISPLLTPVYMKVLANQLVPVELWSMMWDIIKIVILPIVGGVVFNKLTRGRATWLRNAMPAVSMAGIVVILTIMTAVGRDNLLTTGLLLIVAALIHNIGGYLLGYWSSRALRLDERSCRTIAFEVGMQNAGLATGLALQMGKAATVGLAAVVFGPLMNITGSALATWWRDRPIRERGRVGTRAA